MNLKEKDLTARRVLRRYSRFLALNQTLHEDDIYYRDYLAIRFALESMDPGLRFLLEKEYLQKSDYHWWTEYYAKTTYYRLKNKALDEFFAFIEMEF